MKNKKFIPIWQFCKETGAKREKVYRWIRERKIPEDGIMIKKVELTRLFINKDSINLDKLLSNEREKTN